MQLRRRLMVRLDRFGREYLAAPADRRRVYLTLIPWTLALALVALTGVICWPLPF